MPEALCAIDCGSNSTRALIVDGSGAAVVRAMVITRLSEGVDALGVLDETAMERTFAVLRGYREACDRAAVARGLLVATSAVRDASNGEEFLARAGELMGFDAVVLSGAQEAAYSYAGATAGLAPASRPTMIVDVGGGSTELAVEVDATLASFSMQLGCVRVTERALGRDPVTPERAAAARAMIEAELDRAFAAVPTFAAVAGRMRLVGLAGTVATLVQLDEGLEHYDRDRVHHHLLRRTTVREWRDRLGRETPAERLAHPGMVRGREDVLVAGLYVLDAVMERLQVDEVLSSEDDILDGIVASLRRP